MKSEAQVIFDVLISIIEYLNWNIARNTSKILNLTMWNQQCGLVCKYNINSKYEVFFDFLMMPLYKLMYRRTAKTDKLCLSAEQI